MSLDSSVLSSRDDTIRIEKKKNDRKIRRTKTRKTKENKTRTTNHYKAEVSTTPTKTRTAGIFVN